MIKQFPRWVWLVLGVTLLYFTPSLLLEVAYGPSYSFLSYSDQWVPDGNGGWKAEGFPEQRRPDSKSENIPLFLKIMPFLLPTLLISLYLLSPLAQLIEKEGNYKETNYNPEKYSPTFVEEMPELQDEENPTK